MTTSYYTNVTYSPPIYATNWANTVSSSWPGAKPMLATNYYSTNTTFIPSPAPVGGITTNYVGGAWMTNNGSPPASGTYMPGTLSSKTIGTWAWQSIASTSYTYNLPFYTYLTLSGYTYARYSTNTYDHILIANNRYVAGSIAGKKTYVEGPNVTLVLTNGLTGAEQIIWSKGASLTVYCGGTSCGLSGNNLTNPNGDPSSFVVYAVSSVTNLALSGNGQFTGVVIAHNADGTLNGGGNSTEHFCGMIVLNSLTLNGHYAFHFDESLAYPAFNTAATLTRSSVGFSGGKFGFDVSAIPGFIYVVEASTNLADWFPLATNTAPFSFSDPDSPNCPARFYRAVYKGGP